MLYWFTEISQNIVLKLKLKHHRRGNFYSHSIIYGQKNIRYLQSLWIYIMR